MATIGANPLDPTRPAPAGGAVVCHTVTRASAGTGKTWTLSNRYLKLLRLEQKPEHILATTFTRKAAGEILGRVLVRLSRAAAGPEGAADLGRALREPALSQQDCQAMLARLCASLHRVAIGTIDSFFHRVVRSFRHELGVPANPLLTSEGDPRARQVRRLAIDALLADEDPAVLLDLMRRLHHDSAQRSVAEALEDIVGQLYEVYRQAPQAEYWERLTAPGTLDLPQVAELVRGFEDVIAAAGDRRLAAALGANRQAALAGRWQEFLEGGLAKVVAEGRDTYYRKPLPPAVLELLRPLVAHAQADLVGRVVRQTQATRQLLERFHGHYQRLRRRHRLMLFSDLPQLLAGELAEMGPEALGDVYFRLDGRITHLLLDEFQDTSFSQWQVLKPMAQEITAHGQAQESGRSFFCVGDAKQAIYGWRGGCAGIFETLEADLQLPPAARTHLSLSFRSSPVVLGAVNRVFGGIGGNPALAKFADQAAAWQKLFQEHGARHTDRPGYVELATTLPRPQGVDAADLAEDEDDAASPGAGEEGGPPAPPRPHELFVAQRVGELAAAHPGRSLGVLATTNAMVHRLIHQLRQQGLQASGEGGNPLTDDPAVNAVLAALTLADHPGDGIAMFHVEHGPLGRIVGLLPGQPGVAAAGIRRDLLTRGYAGTLTRWVHALAPSCSRRNLLRLGQLVELAEQYEPDLTLRPAQFVEFVRVTTVEEPAPAAIRVMTVHKAKGLEFDIVVLPELDRPLGRMGDLAVYVERNTPRGLAGPITGVYRGAPQAVRQFAPELEAAYQQELARRLQDDLCALYVAMTRPRFALHLFVQPLRKKKDGSPMAWGLTSPSAAAVLRHALRPEGFAESFEGRQTLYASGDPAWTATVPGDRAPAAAARQEATGIGGPPMDASHPPHPPQTRQRQQPPPTPPAAIRSWRFVAPSSREGGGVVAAGSLLEAQASEARRRGTLIHAWLAAIEWLTPGSEPDDQALISLAQAAQIDGGTEAWARARIPAFRAMLARPAVRNALAAPTLPAPGSAVEVWRERSFVVRQGRELLRGTLDRVTVVRTAGRPTRAELLDYKTDAVDADGGNLPALAEHYRPQIAAYRQALAGLLDLPAADIAAALLFLGPGRRVPL